VEAIEKIEEMIEELQEAIKSDKYTEIDDIDIYSLEEEWRKQSGIYKVWSGHLADAKKLVSKIDELKDIRKALVDRDVRRQPSRYNLDKATNEAITSITVLDTKYKELSEYLIEAKYLQDVLFGVIISLEHRRDGLSNEVKLHLSNYYEEGKRELSDKEKYHIDKRRDRDEVEEQNRGLNRRKK
jgi:hypothetical protein